MKLAKGDAYGAREELLLHADLLLDEAALRQLVAGCEAELDALLAAARVLGERNRPAGVFAVSARAHLLSHALRDPDVHARAACGCWRRRSRRSIDAKRPLRSAGG